MSEEATILTQIKELVENSAQLSVAFVNQQRINDMRTIMDELKGLKAEIDRAHKRIDKSAEYVKQLMGDGNNKD